MRKRIGMRLHGIIGERQWEGLRDPEGKKIYSYKCKCGNDFAKLEDIISQKGYFATKLKCLKCGQEAYLSSNGIIFSNFREIKSR